jgi:DNA polymerase-3 subunit gamma/tau
MSDNVLYRKWRPLTFNEVVGQEHVTTTLVNSISLNQTSHAYLFTGPRGVGKTTMARVLAKAMNCTITPNCCLQPKGDRNFCDSCKSINDGNMIDLIEIDAASNRSIDDIRDIKEKSLFAPNIGNCKVYIIDEAHGLTGPAQQAFLKLLEEPPRNVIIILATTEINSIPQTIISRCQRFDFNRINTNQMSSHLKLICDAEEIKISEEACNVISLNSSGSLRDAENILQQISSLKNEDVKEEDVYKFLGLSRIDTGVDLTINILKSEIDNVLKLIQKESESGTDPLHLKNQVLKCLRTIIYLKHGLSNLLEETESTITSLMNISKEINVETVNKISKLLINSQVEPNEFPPLSLEVALIECCSLNENGNKPAVNTVPESAPVVKNENGNKPAVNTVPESAPVVKNENGNKPAVNRSIINNEWKSVCNSLRRVKGNKYFIGGLLNSVSPVINEGKINLIFKSNTMKQNFLSEIANHETKQKVMDSIKDNYNERLELIVDEIVDSSIEEQNPLVKTPIVQHAISMGAKIKKNK